MGSFHLQMTCTRIGAMNLLPLPSTGRGPGWEAGQDMGDTLSQDMGDTLSSLFVPLLPRSGSTCSSREAARRNGRRQG